MNIWPSEWTYDQWIQKKMKHPWLICNDGKIGCEYCKAIGELKTYKSQGVEISSECCQTKIDGGTNSKVTTRLSMLRHKISKHNKSKAHNYACSFSKEKTLNSLRVSFETSSFISYQSTMKVFRTVYCIAV